MPTREWIILSKVGGHREYFSGVVPALSGKPTDGTRTSDFAGHIAINREVPVCHGPACPAVPNEYRKHGSGRNVVAATSCSLRSARIASGLTHFFLWVGLSSSWSKNLMGMFHLFPLFAMLG